MGFLDRLQHAWNAFTSTSQSRASTVYYGASYGNRPDRVRLFPGTERTIIASVYTRLAIDVASVNIRHVRIDQNEKYAETIRSHLNDCFSVEANKDQTGRQFFQDVALSLFDEGAVAIVPVDTTLNPKVTGSYDILSLRVAKITEWYPDHVRCRLYDDRKGEYQEVTLPKKMVAIVENPFYSVMNEPNSTLKRLSRKLALLDAVDEQTGSGKLDLIIQLPYVIKSEARRRQAEDRRKDIENQLSGSRYGIAYTDGTERITQLNRPLENNLMSQIEYLTRTFYNQLGLTESVFDGTADDKVMLNYETRTVEPIVAAICGAMRRAFLTKTARSQGQSIMFFRDPFRLVPVNDIAEIADKFTRNEILSTNEIRAIIGYRPVDDPRANELRNKNLNQEADAETPPMAIDQWLLTKGLGTRSNYRKE